ncbi:hypothetical protein [Leptolyngbya sp. NIES-2104]|uniref:hypothetical protein n=1 Tax=Leptolyngbya sp. NIES-2104 TaxID=1552121 RepID=UPI0006ECC6E2|nr:hypothetical protein [Leptolyngbya sp. NIES-2104]GAP96607.1 hypothetical protein NIES2104_31500 [Leptolyngbya sp. NIES-2104]
MYCYDAIALQLSNTIGTHRQQDLQQWIDAAELSIETLRRNGELAINANYRFSNLAQR